MVITDEQLKGNWGEQLIAANLAAEGCLIRHVTQGHDSGIDLYCETVKDNIPFLHFWCQVKTSKKYCGKKEKVPYTPIKKHREYWLTQPVPVFIFLVPDLRDEKNIPENKPYYICRAFDLRYNETIKSFLKIESSEVSKFLNIDLALETLIWELKDGKVSHLKTPENDYTKKYLSGIVQEFEPEVLSSLLNTLWRLSQDILFHGISPNNLLKKDTLNNDGKMRFETAIPYIEALEILMVGKNDEQYQNYATMGVYYELKKEYNKSLEYYEKSLSIINTNSNINKNEDSWKKTIKDIEEHIKRVKTKMPMLMSSDSLVG